MEVKYKNLEEGLYMFFGNLRRVGSLGLSAVLVGCTSATSIVFAQKGREEKDVENLQEEIRRLLQNQISLKEISEVISKATSIVTASGKIKTDLAKEIRRLLKGKVSTRTVAKIISSAVSLTFSQEKRERDIKKFQRKIKKFLLQSIVNKEDIETVVSNAVNIAVCRGISRRKLEVLKEEIRELLRGKRRTREIKKIILSAARVALMRRKKERATESLQREMEKVLREKISKTEAKEIISKIENERFLEKINSDKSFRLDTMRIASANIEKKAEKFSFCYTKNSEKTTTFPLLSMRALILVFLPHLQEALISSISSASSMRRFEPGNRCD